VQEYLGGEISAKEYKSGLLEILDESEMNWFNVSALLDEHNLVGSPIEDAQLLAVELDERLGANFDASYDEGAKVVVREGVEDDIQADVSIPDDRRGVVTETLRHYNIQKEDSSCGADHLVELSNGEEAELRWRELRPDSDP
jgi:hypothetical protein